MKGYRKAYVDMKAKEKGITMPEYAENKQGSTREHGGRDNRPFNAFRDWNARNGGGGHSDRAPREVKVFVEGKELEVDQETGRVKNQDEITYQSGKVARFEGAGDFDDANPMTLKVCWTILATKQLIAKYAIRPPCLASILPSL
jgi:hypothetical protein